MDGFSFPSLPKPKALPPKNPLLAAATVTDRSLPAARGTATEPAAAAQAGAAEGSASPAAAAAAAAAAGQDMGGLLAKPVALSRHQRIVPAPRRKVPFEKGYSQMDWVRLTQTHPDLAGLAGQRPRRGITMEEVAQHRTEDDAWTVLAGKVYNITHYLRFHPGGVPLLLKVAGKDGTALFTKFHAWVNYDFLLAKCLVGLLAPASAAGGGGGGGNAAAAPASSTAATRAAPAVADAAAARGSHRSSGGDAFREAGQEEEEQQQQPQAAQEEQQLGRQEQLWLSRQ
ncbi:hypothetical protein D9Q98_004799 [Chlorella vulgaris]|uniref:Cytochrome b5 heme-binding domain-containing protein n=1 Tax=Chlorella vulgaris TaxID=3077 RepID=A0A9D4TQD5_CHLVU|nr:hypothetical protein D9Q98_004799 [Chlorella vulgaris]